MQQIYYRLERIYPPTVRICPLKGLTKKANRLSSRSIRKDEHNFLYDQLVDPETHLRHSTLKRKKKEAEKAERGGEICGNLLKRVPKSPKFLVFGIFARWELRWNLENGPNWSVYIYIYIYDQPAAWGGWSPCESRLKWPPRHENVKRLRTDFFLFSFSFFFYCQLVRLWGELIIADVEYRKFFL